MARAIRATQDLSQGHCYSPTFSLVGSPDVFVNGKPVVRQTDNYSQTHCCGPACHAMGIAEQGSTTVFVNNLGIHRDGDKISCGDVADNGSTDVLIDEGSPYGSPNSPEFGIPPNAYSDPSDPENTTGYTVGGPVLEYNISSSSLIVYRTCNKIYIDSWTSSSGRVALIPEYYSPILEENTGITIRDETIPKIMEVDPPLPPPYNIDLNTGIITLTGEITQFYSDSIHTITVNNYVSEYLERPTKVIFNLSASQKPVSFNTGSGGIIYFNCQ
jgi:uncharacterized Zn-binding protein involved in type VI secretion